VTGSDGGISLSACMAASVHVHIMIHGGQPTIYSVQTGSNPLCGEYYLSFTIALDTIHLSEPRTALLLSVGVLMS